MGRRAEVVLQVFVLLDRVENLGGFQVSVLANQPVDLGILAKLLTPGASTISSPPSAIAMRVR